VESRRHFAGFPPLHFSKDGGLPHFPDMPAQIKLTQRRGTTVINLAVAALIIAALVGREIFVPVALAVLLSFVLAPFVIRMQSWRIPRTLSVLVVVFVGFSIIFSLGGLMVSQASRLAAALRIGIVLDVAMGTRWLGSRNPFDRLLGCRRPACRPPSVPGHHAW
jgi:hypothetical protein